MMRGVIANVGQRGNCLRYILPIPMSPPSPLNPLGVIGQHRVSRCKGDLVLSSEVIPLMGQPPDQNNCRGCIQKWMYSCQTESIQGRTTDYELTHLRLKLQFSIQTSLEALNCRMPIIIVIRRRAAVGEGLAHEALLTSRFKSSQHQPLQEDYRNSIPVIMCTGLLLLPLYYISRCSLSEI